MQNNGIATEIYSLINNEEVRPTSNLIISKCSAYDYLNNSNPNLEKLTTQYYETFAITGRFTGYFSNITIGDFYNNLSSIYCDSTAILGGLNSTAREQNSQKSNESSSGGSSGGGGSSSGGSSSGGGSSGGGGSSSQTINPNSSEQDSKNQEDVITNPEDLIAGTSSIVGDRGTENFGIAVFNKDKLCGELTAVESICHLLIQNKIDSCIVSIDNPFSKKEKQTQNEQEQHQQDEKEKMELQIFPRENTSININLKDKNPKIAINMKLHADILTLDENINYETNEILTKISDAAKDYLANQFNDYLDKITKEYNVDIDHFCTKAPAHFLTISDWKNYNWEEKFKNSEFDVNIDVNVLSTMLVTKT